MKHYAAFLLLLAGLLPAGAQSLDEARDLMNAGNYAEAQSMLDYLIGSSPRASNAGEMNLLAGRCALALHDTDAATNYFSKAAARGVADAYLYTGRMAMADYDFDGAREQYNKYVSLRRKAGKSTDEGEAGIAAATAGADMLDRVERIEVIDAVEFPLSRLAEMVVISAQAGYLSPGADGTISFTSSDRRLRYSCGTAPDSDSIQIPRIFEQTLLLDGQYDSPQPIMEQDMPAAYPFMMPDGCTFYFASEQEGGLGGYDIYRSNRDSEDGSFMGAVNMGMPYNSPANDYLLAIDEHTGVGWLVTDRNASAPDMVTAYIFVPREVRENYDPETTEDLISFARLDQFALTKDPDKDYSPLLQAIEHLRERQPEQTSDTFFELPDGRIISSFKDSRTRREVQAYQAEEASLQQLAANLSKLYSEYASSRSSALEPQILELEQELQERTRAHREQKQRLSTLLTR